jgi:trehalose synthase
MNKLSLNNYASIIGNNEVEKIRTLAEKISRASVCHVNATSYGGGVAEILHRLVPLMQDVGLAADWKVMEGTNEFFNVTKTIHNALQGMKIPLTEDMKNTYLRFNEMNAEMLNLDYDYVVMHDPQPLAMIKHYHKRIWKWIWRCHIDISEPNQEFIDFLTPFVKLYDASIFTMKQFVKKSMRTKNPTIIPPSIDPLSNKNKPLSENTVLSILEKYDVKPDNPIVTQVSRFDPWKDPIGVIDVYRIVKKKIPKVQLLLIASMARDDPEGWVYYEKTARHAEDDYDIHLLTDMVGVKDLEVNAFQRASNVILQKSIREGFGLSVTEALWKRIPVVGSSVGGIPLQIVDGATGYLVNTAKEAAEKTLYLLKHSEKAKKMGEEGRKHVLRKFLITRHLKDYLNLFIKLSHTN